MKEVEKRMSKIKNKFWNWTNNLETNAPELRLEGEIASETWWGDEVTPKLFKDELRDLIQSKGYEIKVD